jgi:hypothetical protein
MQVAQTLQMSSVKRRRGNASAGEMRREGAPHIAERVAVENERCKYSAESAAESNTLVKGGEGSWGNLSACI